MTMKVHRWKTKTALAAAAILALTIGAAPSQAAPLGERPKVSTGLSASDLSKLPLTDRHLTKREKANLAVVLRAYPVAEGDVLDAQGSSTWDRRGARAAPERGLHRDGLSGQRAPPPRADHAPAAAPR